MHSVFYSKTSDPVDRVLMERCFYRLLCGFGSVWLLWRQMPDAELQSLMNLYLSSEYSILMHIPRSCIPILLTELLVNFSSAETAAFWISMILGLLLSFFSFCAESTGQLSMLALMLSGPSYISLFFTYVYLLDYRSCLNPWFRLLITTGAAGLAAAVTFHLTQPAVRLLIDRYLK